MDKIQIHMLGGFHVFVNDVAVDEQVMKTKKGCLLLQYLILQRGKPVPCIELYEALWPNDENSNPANALKTLVSRTRATLGKLSPVFSECIATQRGSYRFNDECGIEVDVYEFENILQQLSGVQTLTPEVSQLYSRLLTIFAGDLLPYNSGEGWVVPRNVDMHNRYVKAIINYIDMLREKGDFDEIIRVARIALDVDAFDERLHIALMDALARSGRNNESLLQYKHATNIYYRYLGSQPPEELQEFYKQIITAGQELEMNIDLIKADLAEAGKAKGAFVCEYVVFKDIYHLQARSLERLGISMFIVLMKVNTIDGKPMEPLKLNDVMHRLLDVLRNNLRKGDIVTQFSPTQYALLLPTVNYDTGKMVMERIRRVFYKEQANSNYMLTYRFGPVDGKSV